MTDQATLSVVKDQALNLMSQMLSATQDLANHAGQIGQVAWQATLDVVRVNCLDNLSTGFLWLFIALIVAIIGKCIRYDDTKYQAFLAAKDKILAENPDWVDYPSTNANAIARWEKNWMRMNNCPDADWGDICGAVKCGIYAASAVTAVIGIFCLWNVWAWVGVFHPDLYLAHLALNKVMSMS